MAQLDLGYHKLDSVIFELDLSANMDVASIYNEAWRNAVQGNGSGYPGFNSHPGHLWHVWLQPSIIYVEKDVACMLAVNGFDFL